MAYKSLLKRMQEEKKKKEKEVYVVEDEKGNKVNQDRVQVDRVLAPYKQSLENRTKVTRSSTTTKSSAGGSGGGGGRGGTEKKWYQKILQAPDAFDDGYQFGDITKTVGGTIGDVGLGVVKGIANVGEGIGDLLSIGTAQVADWVGQDEWADKVRTNVANQQGHVITKSLDKGQKAIDDYSVIGDTGDKVSEAAGYIASIWATGAAGGGAAQTATMFGSSAGGTFSESYAKGASDGEAWAKAITTGGIETLVERSMGMFGTSKFDKNISKAISSKISSSAGKVLANVGVQATSEATEEFISYAGNYLVDNHIIDKMGEADYSSEWNWEDVGEQMAVAFIASGALGSVGNINSTQDIAPIDNTAQIEGLQNALEEKTQELKQSQDAREQQIIQDEIEQLNTELNEETNAQQITDENQLKQQHFTYEMSENDSDIKKALYESASKYMNNTTRSHEFVDTVAKIAEDRGTVYEFVNTDGLKEAGYNLENATINGLVTEDGRILVNIDSNQGLDFIVGHETTHLLEGTEEYQGLQELVIEYAKEKGIYEDRVTKLTNLYQGTNADINAELTSDLVGEFLFTDQAFVENLSVKQPNVFQKIYNYIKHIYNMATAGSKEARQLEQIKYQFDKAYKAQTAQTSTNTKYSVSDNINISDEVKDYYSGETLSTMSAKVDGEVVGTVEYGEHEGKPNVKMIEVKPEYRRQGIATKLLQELQKKYPDQEIDFGMSTEDGTNLLKNITYQVENKEYINTQKQLEKITNRINEIETDNVWNDDIDNEYYKLLDKQRNLDKKLFDLEVDGQNTKKTFIKLDESTTDNQGRTLSKEQQEFFKDSKVRDENGNLLTMYHGSPSDFTIFNKSLSDEDNVLGKGFYFTSDWGAAQHYSTKQGTLDNGKVYEIYLNIQNPFIIDDLDTSSLAEKIHEIDPDVDIMDYDYGVASTEKMTNYLIDNGYDGIKAGYETYVVFNSNQIKNVDNTNPTSNPDIRYSLTPDYGMQHRPSTDYGDASNFEENMPDVFEHPEWYMFGGDEWYKKAYKESLAALRKVRGNPDGEITIYRATIGDSFNEGDWVSPSKTYAENHNYAYLDGKGKVIELTVKAKDIRFAGDDLNEFGYFPNGVDEDYSLSPKNEEEAPIGNVFGKDLKVQLEEVIAPLQETINNLTEQVQEITEQYQETAPFQEVQPTQPTLEEIQNLIDIRDNKSGSEYASAFFALRDKYGQTELYKSLNEYYSDGTVTQPGNVGDIDLAPATQEIVEQQGQEAFENITDNEAPIDVDNMSFEDAVFEAMDSEEWEYNNTEHIPSPLDSRDIDEVGNRKIKAYQYENPEVKPFFQAEAENMIYDLDNTIKGERVATHDEEGYITGWSGITRQTTEAIAYLKDNYGYSYDQIRQGLNKIIEDDGLENNAVSKRIEFMLDERLREGYTTSDGIPIPANEDYIKFLNEKQITEYNKEAFNTLNDNDIPVETAAIQDAPLYEAIEPQKPSTTAQNMQDEQSIPMKRITAQNENTDVPEGKQRKWVKTSTESEVVNREILPDDLDQTKIMYNPITNKATLNTANSKLSALGYEKAVEYFNNQILNKKTTVEDVALGERLIQEAIRNKDTKTAGELIQNVAILGTELGQKVQALSIIQRMTPEGQLKMLEKTINRGKIKGDKAFTDVDLTQDMKDKILNTYNDDGSYNKEALDKAVEDVKQEIANQMGSTTLDKINAWRYLSMLGNPKTHIRNLVSNVAMKGTVAVKNALARTIETIAPIENRTRTWRESSEAVDNFARQTALEMKDIISGDSKYSETADIKSKRDVFKIKILNKLANINSNLLEKEDWWFSKGAFENSFSEFLTANGIETEQDIQNNANIVEKGKLYATEQAQIATFRQYSWLANKIRDIESKNAATSIAVGSILPFKKTPINIAKTGLSYSPLGFAKTLTYDIAQVKKGNMEASTLIDHLAQNTTGTALTLVGYMLAQSGLLNGAGDDDKEGKYDYQLGKQAYSLNIGGNTYSLSWLSPVAMPLFVGANAYEQLVEGEEWNADVVLETLGQTLDPLSEMSFLSSLDSVLSSYDSGVQRFFGIGEAMAQNYITQFVPTASSQLAATLDDTKRTTKVSGDSNMKVVDEIYNSLIYKIPGLRETLEPTLDIWGNEVKQSENLMQRAFENFISPYTRKESIATEIDEELKDLYSQTGDNGILPSVPYNYVNFNGEKYNMSAKEFTDYKKTYGQTANDLLEDLFRTTTYQRATSEERTEMVNKVYDYARDEAKLEYLNKEGLDYTNAKEDGEDVYKENLIKGAIENDMSVDEYELYVDDPEEYSFLKEKDYSYRRKYFDTHNSLKEIDKSFEEQKEGINDDDELDVLYSEKKTSIINSIVDSGLEDTEKASLYKKYYNSDTVDTILKSAISIDDYLTYETKEFKADKNEKGNSIPGSRKDKVIDYVNSLELNIPQKAIIIKSTNTFKFNDYNEEIIDYVNSLDLDYQEKVDILDGVDIKVDSEGNIYWD